MSDNAINTFKAVEQRPTRPICLKCNTIEPTKIEDSDVSFSGPSLMCLKCGCILRSDIVVYIWRKVDIAAAGGYDGACFKGLKEEM